MELETKRLKIISCTEETLHMAINQNYVIRPHISYNLEQLRKDRSLLNWGSWLVVRKSDGRIMGDIGFKGKPDENGTVEVGYGFLEDYWNNGYATEAVQALIHWAFQTSRVEKVRAETLQDNDRSIRVLEKLGFVRTGYTETMINWEKTKPIS